MRREFFGSGFTATVEDKPTIPMKDGRDALTIWVEVRREGYVQIPLESAHKFDAESEVNALIESMGADPSSMEQYWPRS